VWDWDPDGLPQFYYLEKYNIAFASLCVRAYFLDLIRQ
jgi:hypothetical protein